MSNSPVIIPVNQGAIKISELATDNAFSLLGSAQSQDNLAVQSQLSAVLGDSLRKNSYILFSEASASLGSTGQVTWQQETLAFGNGPTNTGIPSNVVLRLLQTELGFPNTVDLILQGAVVGSPTATTFDQISFVPNSLIYLELSRSAIESSGGSLIIQNAINGGSLVSGQTLRQVTVGPSSGMPSLQSPIPGNPGNTDTCNIPLAMMVNVGGSLGTNYILWIPHGIAWNSIYNAATSTWTNTISTLGAVLTSGLEALPDFFVSSQSDLQAAITSLTNGGIICVTGPITIGSGVTINLPAGTEIIGKSVNRSVITVQLNGQIILGNNCKLSGLSIVGASNLTSGAMISMPNTKGIISECIFQLTNTSGLATCITVSGIYNRIKDCTILGVNESPYQVGIDYTGGSQNADSDTYIT